MTNPQKPTNYSRLMAGSCNCPFGLPLPKENKSSFCGFGVGKLSIVPRTIPKHLATESLPRLKKELPWAWVCVALGWKVYIAMHASWCSPACVGHVCGKPCSMDRHHWTSLCSCGLKVLHARKIQKCICGATIRTGSFRIHALASRGRTGLHGHLFRNAALANHIDSQASTKNASQ